MHQKSVVSASGLDGPAQPLTGFAYIMLASSTKVRALYGLDEPYEGTEVRIDANQSDSFEPVGTLNLPPAHYLVPGVVAWNNRVAAAMTRPGDVTWTAGELVGNEVTTIAGGTLPRTTLAPLALAVLGDRLLLAAADSAHATGLELNVFDGANGQLSSTPAQSAIVAPSYPLGDDVVMAAPRGRIALVWTAPSLPFTGGPTGGWALLSCGN